MQLNTPLLSLAATALLATACGVEQAPEIGATRAAILGGCTETRVRTNQIGDDTETWVVTTPPPEPTTPEPTTPALPVDTGDPIGPLPDGLTPWEARLWLTPLVVRAEVARQDPISLDVAGSTIDWTVESLTVLEVLGQRLDRGLSAGDELPILLRTAEPVALEDGGVLLPEHLDAPARLGAEVVVHLFPMVSPVQDGTTWWVRMFGPPDERAQMGVFVKSRYDDGDFVASSSGLRLLQEAALDQHVWLFSLDAADDERDGDGNSRAPSRFTRDAISWDAYLSELRARVGGLP